MNWKELGGQLLKGGASLLGQALIPIPGAGAAAGGAVGGWIAKALGVDAEPGAISAALAGNPEAFTRLRELEIEKEAELRQIIAQLAESEEKQVTARHGADMASDSRLSKNIRPLTLAALVVGILVFILLDGALDGFKVSDLWIERLMGLAEGAFYFYFGGRSLEKGAQILTGSGVTARLRGRRS